MSRHVMFAMLIWALPAASACGTELDDPTASVAQAASNVHLVGELRCRVSGTQVVVTGKVAGLGEPEATAVVTADAFVTVLCVNRGGNPPPGQTAQVTATGTATIQSGTGNVPIRVATDPIVAPVPGVMCPNAQFTQVIEQVEFGPVTLTIEQEGQIVLTETCIPE